MPTRADYISLLRLALPVMLVQVGMMAMGVVDTVVVGRLSEQALGAVGLGNIYFWGVGVLTSGVLGSLDPVISQAVGAGDTEAAARGVQRGAMLAVMLSVLAAALLLPVEPVLGLLRQHAGLTPLASQYVRISIAGVMPLMFFNLLRQTLQARHRLAPIVWATVLANGVNAVLAIGLVYGRFGLPAWGVAGSAWATAASRWLMCGLVVALSWCQMHTDLWPIRHAVMHRAPLLRMLRLGVPIGLQMWLEFAAFAVIGLMMGTLGTTQMAAHQIALNLASLTFMVPLAAGQSASVLVGNAIGAGDQARAKRAATAAIVVGFGFMCITAVIFRLMPRPLSMMYTADPAVVALAATLIPIAGLFQVFDGLQAVGAGILRGAGDTHAAMVINIFGFWLTGVPVSVALAFYFSGGAVGLWWGFVAGLAVVASLLMLRVRQRFKREIGRVVVEQQH